MTDEIKNGYNFHCNDSEDPIELRKFEDTDDVVVINVVWTENNIGKSHCFIKQSLCKFFGLVPAQNKIYRLPIGYIDEKSKNAICNSSNLVFLAYKKTNNGDKIIYTLEPVDEISFLIENKIIFLDEDIQLWNSMYEELKKVKLPKPIKKDDNEVYWIVNDFKISLRYMKNNGFWSVNIESLKYGGVGNGGTEPKKEVAKMASLIKKNYRNVQPKHSDRNISDYNHYFLNHKTLYKNDHTSIGIYKKCITVRTYEDIDRMVYQNADNTDSTEMLIIDSELTNLNFIPKKFTNIRIEFSKILVISLPIQTQFSTLTDLENNTIEIDSKSQIENLFVGKCETRKIKSTTNDPVHIHTLFLNQMDDLIELPRLINTRKIKIQNCRSLEVFDCVRAIYEKINIKLINLASLRSIPYLPKGLKILYLTNCPNLVELPEVLPEGIKNIYIDTCPELKLPKNLPNSMRLLSIKNCRIKIPNKTNPKTQIEIE